MRMYLCGCPQADCKASSVGSSSGVSRGAKNIKAHASREDAYRCFVRYLESTGHIRLSPREFETPQGTILLLNKRTHFGAELRGGKSEAANGKPSRFMPRTRGGGAILG